MVEIPLDDAANQSFTVTLDGRRYDFTIKEANGVMCVDLSRDDVVLLQGSRLVAGSPLIPFRYMEAGNFVLMTEDDDLPYYVAFGYSQTLYYVSADEVAALRAA